MLDRDRHLGTVSERRVVEVEKGFVKFFAEVTGETNPIYFDEVAARAAGHRTIPIPPTYLFSLQLSCPARRGDLFDKKSGLGIDMMKVLHGEQAFTHHRMIYVGDRISMTTTIVDIYDKKSGALEFVVQETRFENDARELCAEARQVTVVRNG